MTIIKHSNNPSRMISNIFSCMPCLEYWSQDGLESLYQGTYEMVSEHYSKIDREKAKIKGAVQARITKFVNRARKIVVGNGPRVSLTRIYNEILAADNLSTLPGFGLAITTGANLMDCRVNPEVGSIVNIDQQQGGKKDG